VVIDFHGFDPEETDNSRCAIIDIAMTVDWLIMVGWDYVSEMWSPTGLLFIHWVICEHGDGGGGDDAGWG
jgi:hypothetical protein